MLLTTSFLIDAGLFFTTFLLIVYLYYSRHFEYWKKQNIPFIKPTIFFGNFFKTIVLHEMGGEKLERLYKNTNDPLLGLFSCDVPFLLLRDKEVIKDVLIKDFNYFVDRTVKSNKKNDPLGSYMLFFLDNPDWRQFRIKLSPIFTSAKLKTFHDLIKKAGDNVKTYLHEFVKKDSKIDVKTVTFPFTTQVIISVAFGLDENCFDGRSQFMNTSYGFFDMESKMGTFQLICYTLLPTLVYMFKLKAFRDEYVYHIRDVFLNVFNRRQKSREYRNDLIDFLIKINDNQDVNEAIDLDQDKLSAQALQFFIAGFETTGSTLLFLLYELSHDFEVQNRLRKEIVDTVKKHEGRLDYDVIKEMKYLDMCLSETLRKYPIVPFLERRVMNDYHIKKYDVELRKGFSIIISVLGLHYDPQYFADPYKFDPERFSEKNRSNMHLCTYLPFGTGPRNCIGEKFAKINMKTFIAMILPEFEVHPNTPKVGRLEFNKRCFLLCPKNKVYVNLKKI